MNESRFFNPVNNLKSGELVMKRLIASLLIIFSAVLVIGLSPAWAADAAKGAAIFSANCASCHMGGKNVVNPAKTLSKADLDKNAINDAKSITTQVLNGKGAMPSFKGRLSEEQIADVAAYVLAQADKSWAK